MSGLTDTVPADRHPRRCSRWFASDATTGEAICDCGLAEESTVEGLYQHDLAAILRALGLDDYARGDSPHMVVHDEVIPEIRRRVAIEDAARAVLDPPPADDAWWVRESVQELRAALGSAREGGTGNG